MVVSTCQLHLYQEIYRSSRQLPFFGWCWSKCDLTFRILTMAAIVCWQSEEIARSQNQRRMCEIRLTKLSCTAQQVGIVHFYAMTDIKGLSCPLWWMREWRILLTSTHVGYRSVIRAVTSGASLKFGVQGASATNWLSRVNGARDNGIRLYSPETPNLGQIRRFLEAATLKFDTWPWTRQIWGVWKLRPAYSPEMPNLGQNRWCFVPCDLEIWWMTLENNRASLLCCFKLYATFHSHWWIQTGVTVRKRPIWVNSTIFRAVWPWNLTYDLEKQ